MPSSELVVLGAGPKALAIATKRAVLLELGWRVPDLVILEKNEIAANWTGRHGYTDGHQQLGTPPDKDVGFPYGSTCWGPSNDFVNQGMARFSWHAYLIEQGRLGRDSRLKYASWVDRGRPHPPHAEWARYWQWIADKIDAPVRLAEVTKIGVSKDGAWQITASCSGSPKVFSGAALVVTGPGHPAILPGQETATSCVFDGRNFWNNLSQFSARAGALSVCVIGPGETAAAIVLELLKHVQPEGGKITVISPAGVLYSRGESFDENYFYSDAEQWSNLASAERQEFVQRTDRSVFSQHAKQVIDFTLNAPEVETTSGRVVQIEGMSGRARVHVQYHNRLTAMGYDYVVVSTGFDPIWFVQLCDPAVKEAFEEAAITKRGRSDLHLTPAAVQEVIDEALAVADLDPRLHLPMLAGFAQGPGFPNLSSLGALSDRILKPYCEAPGLPISDSGIVVADHEEDVEVSPPDQLADKRT